MTMLTEFLTSGGGMRLMDKLSQGRELEEFYQLIKERTG